MDFNVILVDDDPVALFLHKVIIRKSEFEISALSFNNGKEFMDYFLMNREAPAQHLIFLDINMPVMNGWEVLDSIKDLSITVDVVIVTSSVDKKDYDKATSYKNVIGLIEKPLTLESVHKIKKLMH